MASLVRPKEVFPDLHHKMSKKIAQLTKVIYHLNSKNEDHQFDIQHMAKQHENEISQILSDAASKINDFKNKMLYKQQEINAEAQLQKFKEKYDKERSIAVEEVKTFKLLSAKKEQEIQKNYNDQLVHLREDMNKAKKSFQDNIKKFNDTTHTLRELYESKQSKYENQIDTLKREKEKEIEEVVLKSNQKYEDMLLEKMRVQDDLKRKMQQSCSEIERRLLDDKELAITQLRDKLQAEKQSALQYQAKEYFDRRTATEKEMAAEREQWNSKINEMLEKIGASNESREGLNNEKTNLLVEKARLEAYTKTLSDEISAEKKKYSALKEIESSLRREIEDKTKTNEDRDSQISSLTFKLQELETKIDFERRNLMGADLAKDELKNQLFEADKKYSNLCAHMEEELKRKDDRYVQIVAASEKVKQQLSDEVERFKLEVQRALSEMDESRKAHEKVKQNLQSEIKRLELQIQSLSNESSANTSGLQQEIYRLRKDIEDKERDFSRTKNEMTAAHESLISTLQQEHTSNLLDQANLVHKQEQDTKSQFVQLCNKHKEEIDDLENQLAQMIKEKSNLEIDSQKRSMLTTEEVNSLNTKIEAQNFQISGLQQQITKLQEESGSQSKGNDLLREQIKSSEYKFHEQVESLKQKHKMELLNAEAEWQTKLNAALRNASADTQNLEKMYDDKIADVKRDLNSSHAKELSALQDALERQTAISNESADDSLKFKKIHEEMVENLNKEKEAALQNLQNKYAIQIADLRAQSVEQSHLTAKKLNDKHESEMKNLQEKADAQRRTLETEYREMMKRQQLDFNISMQNAISKANQESAKNLRDSNSQLQRQLSSEHMRELERLKSQHIEDRNKLIRELSETKETLAALNQTLREVREEFASKETSLENKLKQTERDWQGRMEDARRQELNNKMSYESNLSDSENTYIAKLSDQKEAYEEEARKMNDSIESLSRNLKQMEARYLARESRVEDLQKIQKLEHEMIEREALLRRTQEEMMYFKLELINREENYNKTFARSPNVGVMQVAGIKGSGKKDNAVLPSFGSQMVSNSISKTHKRRNSNAASLGGAGGGISGAGLNMPDISMDQRF